MHTKNTSKNSFTSGVHQDFSWFCDDVENFPTADFIGLARDICRGINTCLNIVNTTNLDRLHNEEADPDEQSIPAVSSFDCESLLRLAIVSSRLLGDASERQIDWINKFGAKKMAAMQMG